MGGGVGLYFKQSLKSRALSVDPLDAIAEIVGRCFTSDLIPGAYPLVVVAFYRSPSFYRFR